MERTRSESGRLLSVVSASTFKQSQQGAVVTVVTPNKNHRSLCYCYYPATPAAGYHYCAAGTRDPAADVTRWALCIISTHFKIVLW